MSEASAGPYLYGSGEESGGYFYENLTERAYASLRRRALNSCNHITPMPLQNNRGEKIVCAHCEQPIREVLDLERINGGVPVHVVCLVFGGAA